MKNFKILILSILIGLSLSKESKAQTLININRPNESLVLITAGLTLTTISILQNNADGFYNKTYSNFNNTYTVTYVKPNILTNAPNNLVFGVGVTFTFTGLLSSFRR